MTVSVCGAGLSTTALEYGAGDFASTEQRNRGGSVEAAFVKCVLYLYAHHAHNGQRICLSRDSGLQAIVECQRLIRIFALHVNICSSQLDRRANFGQGEVVGRKRAHRVSRNEPANQGFSRDSAIFRVRSAQDFID
jgi:hypothetical protein